MTDTISKIKETHWINVYISDNPNAPVCNIEFVNKENKEDKERYPIWRDKERPQFGYVGKLDTSNYKEKPNSSVDSHNEAKGNGYQPQDDIDDIDDICPF